MKKVKLNQFILTLMTICKTIKLAFEAILVSKLLLKGRNCDDPGCFIHRLN